MKNFLTSILETVELAFVAVITVLIIRTFLIQPFLVNGASMEPNFSNGDYLLVDELSYRLREPARGEVVVFRYPENDTVFYIKRIIGLPGERLTVKDGKITVFNDANSNGLLLQENYLGLDNRTSGDIDVTLSNDQYFVMGDNRLYSFDSRSWGPLSDDYILGIVRLNLWPPTSIRAITSPTY